MIDIDALIEGNGGLFQTLFPDGVLFRWRLLTLKEYRVFARLRDNGILQPMQLHSAVFDRCYLGDPNLINGNVPAGYEVSLGQLIMHLSGDPSGQEGDEIEAARAGYASNSVHELTKRVVLLAFPSYTLEDIEEWTKPELLRKFTIAESVLVNRGIGYELLDTSKIYKQGDEPKGKKGPQIDFAKENKAIGDAMSGGGDAHAMDMDPSEFKKRRKISQAMEARGLRTNRR